LIELDVEKRILRIIGTNGEKKKETEIEKILAERKKNWIPKEEKYKSGVLNIYAKLAESAIKGGYIK